MRYNLVIMSLDRDVIGPVAQSAIKGRRNLVERRTLSGFQFAVFGFQINVWILGAEYWKLSAEISVCREFKGLLT